MNAGETHIEHGIISLAKQMISNNVPNSDNSPPILLWRREALLNLEQSTSDTF